MFIKKILSLTMVATIISGCSTQKDWNSNYANNPIGTPESIGETSAQYLYGNIQDVNSLYAKNNVSDGIEIESVKNVSVLLPTSGDYEKFGDNIKDSIELVFFQSPDKNIAVNFYDLSGTTSEKKDVIDQALSSNPSVIIGPIFAEEAKMIRSKKSPETPVISFTSDTTALGNGVLSIALIPSQSIETIVSFAKSEERKNMIIFAPNTQSGKWMAGAAELSTEIYDIELDGLFYYEPGNTDSMKTAASTAAMYNTRMAANTKAREILSNIIVNEELNRDEKEDLEKQLENISKMETTGKLPYDSILFLGDLNDSQTITSFLRYYDVAKKDAAIYGTALWDVPNKNYDMSMSDAKFAALPGMSHRFIQTHKQLSDTDPSRIDSFAWDAAVVAKNMLKSDKTYGDFLMNPSGYIGNDGLFRFRPNGENERALEIKNINNNVLKSSAQNFKLQMYNLQTNKISNARAKRLSANNIDVMEFITVPNRYYDKYAITSIDEYKDYVKNDMAEIPEYIVPDDASDATVSENFKPINLDNVKKELITEIEIIE